MQTVKLIPIEKGARSLEFDYDAKTGHIEGKDATTVLAAMVIAEAAGFVRIPPHAEVVVTHGRTPMDLALVFGSNYFLPESFPDPFLNRLTDDEREGTVF